MNAITDTATRADRLWFGNTLASIAVSAADGADALCIIDHHAPFGDSPPLHVHETEDEAFIVLHGMVRIHLAGRDMILRAGDRALAPKGVAHSYRVESPAGATFLTVTRGADFETLVRRAGRPAPRATLPEPETPTPEMIAALTAACAESRISIVGPPLA